MVTPQLSLKISCKSVQPFSRNVADKEISIVASHGLRELTQNVIRSSHGHSTPFLISIAASRGLHELTQKEIFVKVYRRTDGQPDGRTPHGCIGSLE